MKKGLVMSTVVIAALGLFVLIIMTTYFVQQSGVFYETKSVQESIQDRALCKQLTQQAIKANKGYTDTDEDGLADYCDVCPNNKYSETTDTDKDGLSEVGINKESDEPYLDQGYLVNKCDKSVQERAPAVCEFGEDNQRGKCRCRYGFVDERCATKEEWDALKQELDQKAYSKILDELLQKISNGINAWNFQDAINYWEQQKRTLSTSNLENLKSIDTVIEILKIAQVSEQTADNLAQLSGQNKQKIVAELANQITLPYKQQDFTAFAKGIGYTKLGIHHASKKEVRTSRQHFSTAFQEMARPKQSSTRLQSAIMSFAEFIPQWLVVKEAKVGDIGEVHAVFENNNEASISSGSSRGFYVETQNRFNPVYTKFNPARPQETLVGDLQMSFKDAQGTIQLDFSSTIDMAFAKGFDRVFTNYCRPKEEQGYVDCVVKVVHLPGADINIELMYPDFGEKIESPSRSIASDVVQNEFAQAVRTLEDIDSKMPLKFMYKDEMKQALEILGKQLLTAQDLSQLSTISGEKLRLRMAGKGSEDYLIFWTRAKLALLQSTSYDQQRQAFNQIYTEYDKMVDEYTNMGSIQPTQELVSMGRNLNVLLRDSFYQKLQTAQVDSEKIYRVHITVDNSKFILEERGDPHGEPYRTLGVFREPAQGTDQQKTQQRTRLDFTKEYDLTIGRQLLRKLREDCSFVPSGETQRVLYEGCRKFSLNLRIPAHEGYSAHSEPVDLYSKP